MYGGSGESRKAFNNFKTPDYNLTLCTVQKSTLSHAEVLQFPYPFPIDLHIKQVKLRLTTPSRVYSFSKLK